MEPLAYGVVDRLLADRDRARSLARRGQAASARYDWTRLAARVLEVYETVAGGGTAAQVSANSVANLVASQGLRPHATTDPVSAARQREVRP